MDLIEACNIEFLDFTGVDDQEKKRVLSSLHTINSSVQLPWDGEGNNINRCDGIINHNFKQTEVTISLNEQQIEHFHHQTNSPVYPQTINYTNQYVICQSPILPPNYSHYQYTVNNAYIETSYVDPNLISTCAPHNNVQQQQQQQQPPSPQQQQQQQQQQSPQQPKQSSQEQHYQQAAAEEVVQSNEEIIPAASIQQNGTVQENVTLKSWASLFNKPTTNEPVVNGTLKPSFTQAVNNHETNNNNNELCPIRHPRKSQFIDPNSYRIGEFLLSYNLDIRTISLQPRGLINRSNYCYINSILQALLACPPVYNLLSGLANSYKMNDKKKPTPFIDAMCSFVKEFQHLPASMRVGRRNDVNQKKEQNVLINCDPPFEPAWIYKMLNGIRTDSFLVEGRQEDAEEFLGCVLNGLNDEILDLMKLVKNDVVINKIENNIQDQESEKEWQVMGPKNKGSVTRRTEFGQTPISDIFGGLIKSRIHRSGDHHTDNIQPFFTLQLNIEKVKTVREALEALVSKNQIEGMTSQQTNEEVEAWQQVTLEELPVILVLHLKCFDFKLDGCTKIMKALDFPIDLKINSKWMSSKISNQKEKLYKLFAVVYHDGKEATKGHYLTDAFHVGYGSWLRYDDSSVKAVQEEHVLKPQGTRVPYLLFYRRRNY